jgi:CheY-like chemotaxis protein
MAGDRERLLAAGCDGYLEKPIDPARVIDQIRKILGKRP